ncbi:hypothetical protein F8388_004774 [Cannabis sativa]|uniref:Uncharacterized protein n=1 Tax=Cannabis sativa TaxID=3483 RepID=A0A7J6HNF5_CANSA|nr:hypothetical protein F8388_004772 [Cannabis sativa]KAF4396806.1 hypothetical protein F8388_004774 [Cannabis sativa]
MGASPFSTWRYLVHHGVVTEVSDPHSIMDEVYMNGPIELSFTIYELLANQMGWDGYFMIRRGTNECGIEDDMVAGLLSK